MFRHCLRFQCMRKMGWTAFQNNMLKRIWDMKKYTRSIWVHLNTLVNLFIINGGLFVNSILCWNFNITNKVTSGIPPSTSTTLFKKIYQACTQAGHAWSRSKPAPWIAFHLKTSAMTPRVKASGWNNACGAHALDPSSVGSAAGEKQKRGERERQSHQHRNIELQTHDSFSQKQSDTCTTKQGLDLSPLWVLSVKLRPLQMSTSKVTCRNSEWVCPEIIFCQLWGRVIEATTNNTVVYHWLMHDQEVNTFESYLHTK